MANTIAVIIIMIGINITLTITIRITKYTKNIIQKRMNNTTGTETTTKSENTSNPSIANGKLIITPTPNIKNTPNKNKITTDAKAAKDKDPIIKPDPPFINNHNIVVKPIINIEGMKNSIDGIIYSMNKSMEPKKTTKFNIKEPTIDKAITNIDGIKNNIDGSIVNTNKSIFTINHGIKPSIANGNVIVFQIHHNG